MARKEPESHALPQVMTHTASFQAECNGVILHCSEASHRKSKSEKWILQEILLLSEWLLLKWLCSKDQVNLEEASELLKS